MGERNLKLFQKICEAHKRFHRLKRFQRRLIRECFMRGIRVGTLEMIRDDAVDIDPLIDAVEHFLPSLYRGYHENVFKYYQLRDEVAELLKKT